MYLRYLISDAVLITIAATTATAITTQTQTVTCRGIDLTVLPVIRVSNLTYGIEAKAIQRFCLTFRF